jgi:hypothetical protein
MPRASASNTRPKVSPAKKSPVRIRCYRQGLGDCFLLTFTTKQGKPFHLLIDCGVWPKGQPNVDKMRAIAADIVRETGGSIGTDGSVTSRGTIDVLVATHEHWDHLSGFTQARDLFKNGLNVRHVWLAWTEDDSDELANDLRKHKKKTEKAVRHLHAKLAGLGPKLSAAGGATLRQIESALGFLGVDDPAKAGSIDEAMDFVRLGFAGAKPHFHLPGALLELSDVEGVRVYVLGPPHDRAKIRKSTPSTAHSEVYELFFGLSLEDSLLAALDAGDDAQSRFRDFAEVGKPFERRHRQDLPGVRANADSASGKLMAEHYDEPVQAWRKIDDDWLFAGGAIALRLDSATNNTSLVLAFELPDGRVLLFPGDAQVGNWLSWHDPERSWNVTDSQGRAVTVTARDLLARTAFYKAGHHGSHNATLRELGLELMSRPDLIAVVPVSHEMALANHWDRIPLPSLVDRLREKTKGRLWFTVEHPGKFINPDIDKLLQLQPAERAALKNSVTPNELWIDFEL